MAHDLSERPPAEVLEAFGFAGAEARVLEPGQVNTQWLLEGGEDRAVLRRLHVARPARAVAWEQDLLAHTAERGWPVPSARQTPAGDLVLQHEARLWTCASFMEGRHPPEDSLAMHHIYGRLLARLHHDMAGFSLEGQRPGAGKVWELDAWVAPADAGTFNELLGQFARDYPALANVVRRYRYRNLRELSRLHYPDLPGHPIHGDFDPSNLLWHEGKLSAVLDFDWCRRDALACDLAASFPWDNMTGQRIRSFIEGYEEVRPLDDAEWALLPSLTRAHLLFFVAFRLVEWKMLGGTRPAASIERTVRDRLPRTEGLERFLLDLRAGAGSSRR